MLSILLAPLSPLGLMLGALGFVATLTPSMIPRPGVLQGVEAGIAFALLYGVGTGARALWSWLELPAASDHYSRAFLRMSIVLCLALVGYGLARETDWQNAIRRAMGMPTAAPRNCRPPDGERREFAPARPDVSSPSRTSDPRICR